MIGRQSVPDLQHNTQNRVSSKPNFNLLLQTRNSFSQYFKKYIYFFRVGFESFFESRPKLSQTMKHLSRIIRNPLTNTSVQSARLCRSFHANPCFTLSYKHVVPTTSVLTFSRTQLIPSNSTQLLSKKLSTKVTGDDPNAESESDPDFQSTSKVANAIGENKELHDFLQNVSLFALH